MPQKIFGCALAGHFFERLTRFLNVSKEEFFGHRAASGIDRFARAPQRLARTVEQRRMTHVCHRCRIAGRCRVASLERSADLGTKRNESFA